MKAKISFIFMFLSQTQMSSTYGKTLLFESWREMYINLIFFVCGLVVLELESMWKSGND